MINDEFFKFVPNNLVDDYFIWGFISGAVGYAYYLFTSGADGKHPITRTFLATVYGIFLSACVGGLLAIVIDRAYQISIIVGLLNQIIYVAMLRAGATGDFWNAIKDILLQYLTAGTKK